MPRITTQIRAIADIPPRIERVRLSMNFLQLSVKFSIGPPSKEAGGTDQRRHSRRSRLESQIYFYEARRRSRVLLSPLQRTGSRATIFKCTRVITPRMSDTVHPFTFRDTSSTKKKVKREKNTRESRGKEAGILKLKIKRASSHRAAIRSMVLLSC